MRGKPSPALQRALPSLLPGCAPEALAAVVLPMRRLPLLLPRRLCRRVCRAESASCGGEAPASVVPTAMLAVHLLLRQARLQLLWMQARAPVRLRMHLSASLHQAQAQAQAQ